MPPPFLESSARLLLVLHGVLGFAAVGAVTHLATYSVGLWRGREPWRWHTRLFGLLVPLLVVAQFCLGLAIYPAYTVDVRVAWLDAHAPVAVALFDLKEHSAALALPLLLVATLLARRPAAKEVRGVAAVFAVLAAVLVWVAAVLGLYVTTFRAVGLGQ